MRATYARRGLAEADLAPTWLDQFERWLHDALECELPEVNAMVLATAGADGAPSARTVLCKGDDPRGFHLYTNHGSRKGRDMAANPRASLVFPWLALGRQVVVAGAVERLSDATSDAYFASRPRGSRLGALASPQSSVLGSRDELERAYAELAERYPEGADVPRPEHWGGLRVVAQSVEFWQGRPGRMHDRLVYQRRGEGWATERLAP